MSLLGEQILLRVYLQSADRPPHAPTYQAIVKAARAHHLAGATVLPGILGFGRHGIIRESAWSLANNVPVIVEIVDTPQKITDFLHGSLDKLMTAGMLTLERASVMMYRRRSQDDPAKLQMAAPLQPLATIPQIQPGSRMTINQNGVLLRVFIGESDRFDRKPLYQAILIKARELGLAGATVLRGTEGFGANSIVHTASLLAMSTDLPIVIEIVDTQDKIDLLLPHLQTMVQEGMITMEYVLIIAYRHNPADAPAPA